MRSLLTAVLVLLVLWLPLPYGSVTSAGRLIVVLGAGLSVILVGFLPRFRVPRGSGLAFAAGAGLALLAFGQSAVWPRAVATLLSNRHVELAREAAVESAAVTGVYLSLAPDATRSAFFMTLALLALLAAGMAVGLHPKLRRWLAVAILAAASVQVLIGLRPWLAGEVPRLKGSFVNPDHMAVLLEIALAVGLAAIWGVARSGRHEVRTEIRVLTISGVTALWGFLFTGLLLTGSRGALLAALVGLASGGALLAVAAKKARYAAAAAGGGMLLGLAILLVGSSPAISRLLGSSWHELFTRDRPQVWRESLSLVGDFPILGTGLGSFEQAFPLVQDEVSTKILWGRAHNDYLELLLTGGVVGALLGLIAIIGIVRPLIRVLRHGIRTEDRLAAAAALSALAAVGTHEFFDFGLSLPANSATFVILLGAAAASQCRKQA